VKCFEGMKKAVPYPFLHPNSAIFIGVRQDFHSDKNPGIVEIPGFLLVAGEGFEPTASGL
jgi:hypothetical protein